MRDHDKRSPIEEKNSSGEKSDIYQSSDIENNDDPLTNETIINHGTNDKAISKNSKKSGRKILLITIIVSVLLLGTIGGGGYYIYSQGDDVINLVSLSGNKSPTPSENEVVKLRLELENLRNDLDQYIGVNEAVAEMENKIVNLTQRVDNLKEKLNDEISNFELTSEHRSNRLSKITERLSELKVAETITLKNQQEVEKLRQEIKKINEESAVAENKILKQLESYKQMLDLAEERPVTNRGTTETTKAAQRTITNDVTHGEVITKIGPLRLEAIISHGSQRVAELTDDISGAIPIIEGDRIGQYHIKKINADSVQIQDLAGDKFTLVLEG